MAEAIESQWPGGIFRDFEGPRFDALVESIRKDEDRVGITELERQFERLGQSEELLQYAATELRLTVPFDHDPHVRAALQFVVTVVYSIVMVYLLVYLPVAAAIGTVTGTTPSALKVWKYTGTAYDKLYDKKHYHPEKGLDSSTQSKGRRSRGDKGVW
ncbi:hypothetical protein [Arthrobacter sp. B1805]|uniref:hypothetical protein n=1 Tax=Arthrobacter sp. B1805 TaxID=2058892 RepID=UPI0021575F8B|nr:hypothetical protein [Arthrobacter sp. B1805]